MKKIVVSFIIVFIVLMSCNKDNENIDTLSNSFVLTSPEIGQDGLLPIDMPEIINTDFLFK